VLGAAGVLLVVLVLIGVLVATRSGSSAPAAASSATPTPVTVSGSAFAPHGTAHDADCAAHSYGDVQVWLAAHRCAGLHRAQYDTDVAGRRAAVTVAQVDMPDTDTATQLQAVLAAPGGGGITTLVKDGHGWPGGPASFDRAAFTSSVTGTQVRVAQAVWESGASDPGDAALNAVVGKALTLPTTP
jgi:hypothetical protein